MTTRPLIGLKGHWRTRLKYSKLLVQKGPMILA